MTNEEIIEMAVGAGIVPWTKHEYIGGKNFSASDEGLDGDAASLIQFAKLVAAKEREQIIAITETQEFSRMYGEFTPSAYDLVKAIRARGEA